ncbi:MAG: hypothetical protein H6R26_628 [Proteobacteria bacterium]|nr:hypothetical protein [Pseudomonadota bacterium]
MCPPRFRLTGNKNMKPNLLLFSALALAAGMLFLNLPEHPQQQPPAAGLVSRPAESPAEPNASADLKQMRKDYALLVQEMTLLRAKIEQAQAAPAENRHAGLASTAPHDDDTPPGVTIYLDTSKLPPAGSQGQEWTAVGFHDAGQAADGSKRAVLSISKVTRPQAADDEGARTTPVSRWE